MEGNKAQHYFIYKLKLQLLILITTEYVHFVNLIHSAEIICLKHVSQYITSDAYT